MGYPAAFLFKVMNIAANIVSSLMLGERCKTVIISGKGYTIYSPNVKILCRVIREFSKADIGERPIEILMSIDNISPFVLKGISYAIVGDCENYEQKSNQILEDIETANLEEIQDALSCFFDMVSGKEVFHIATSVKNFVEVAAKQKQ